MLTEFKRDNAVKELEKSNQELYVKRNKVKAFDEKVKVKMEQMKQIDSLGLTLEEVIYDLILWLSHVEKISLCLSISRF